MSQGSAQTKAAAISAVAVVLAALIGLVGALITRDGDEPAVDPGNGGDTSSGDTGGGEVGEGGGPVVIDPPENGNGFGSLGEPASVFVNRDSGPGGTEVQLSGEGFDANERVVLRFHTVEIGSTTANSAGSFANVTVTVPTTFSRFAPQQFDIVATGESSVKSARTPFTLTG